MNNKDTFDILRGEFCDCPDLPDSLSKRNVVEKLKGVTQKKYKTISIKRLSYVAAAAVVVTLCAVFAASDFNENLSIQQVDDVATTEQSHIAENVTFQNSIDQKIQGETALLRASSRDEIIEKFLSSYDENGRDYLYGADEDGLKGATGVTEAVSSAGSAVNESFSQSVADKSYAETNIQTEGVDEADVIKTDSRYIYFIGIDSSSTNKKLRIINTETMTAVYDSYIYDENGDVLWISDIYVNDNILVALCSYRDIYNGLFKSCYYYSTGTTVAVSFDITDRSNPKEIRRNTQDGSYRSSRMVGNILYTVSEYYVYAEEKEELENTCIPKVGGSEIACDCIYFAEEKGNSYICFTACDVTDKNAEISSLAVLGSGNQYYCSQDTFYILSERYYYSDEYKDKATDSSSLINAFSFSGTDIIYSATGEVKGRAVSQYSLDEYEGKLRIATTYYNTKTQNNESSLYVLNKDLDIIGKSEDIAKDEQIKSVRYMGDKAYVVTFRNTDPLFWIDLSDPENPNILAEVKLPGYSTYLHPVSENLLVGIGYGGDENSADMNTLKISLFDITDPEEFKELDSIEFNNSCSFVSGGGKAFLYKADEGIMFIPAEKSDDKDWQYVCYAVKIENNKLCLKEELFHAEGLNTNVNHFRGTYIDEHFFTVSDWLVRKFDLNTGEFIEECQLAQSRKLDVTTEPAEENYISDTTTVTVY